MVLEAPGAPLLPRDGPEPAPGPRQVRLRVCGGIHTSDIPAFPYSLLWGERVVRSVANLTRRDGEEFLALAPQVPVRTRTTVFPLADANAALDAVRNGRVSGSAVLVP